MTLALRSEWTKLRTPPPGNLWLLLGVVAATIGAGAALGAVTHVTGFTRAGDATKLSLSGVYVGQLVAGTLAVVSISEEYATGMIHTTIAAIPRRATVLIAKAANVAVVIMAPGLLAAAGCLMIGRLILPGDGLDPAHGYALISLGSAATIRAAGGTVLYMALVALLALGVAAVIRDTAVSMGAVVALLYVPQLLAHIVGGAAGRHIEAIAPMSAGLAIQATTHLQALPVRPWAGLGVLGAWAAGSLLLAALVLRVRDA